ncbi:MULTISPECIES: tyrosine-type recombinase/integrase [Paraburkholderia]|uniref:tyrosine-type recombinase/integrase n=1 Tax=Paraburkholderia TaxID=1822464 RepID=UPI003B7F765C
MEPKHAKILTPAKFRHLLCVAEATSRFSERDTLILLLGITCGMRVTEIARLEVHHVLSKSVTRKEEIGLPGSITKGCRSRCVFLSHVKAVEALDRYVEWRYRRGHGMSLDRREYRGLMPRTRLIVTQKGGAFELSTKRRVNFEGDLVEYLAADSLQSYVTGLYRAAGLGAGYSSHTGRRTFASRLMANGHSLEMVQILLGHARPCCAVSGSIAARAPCSCRCGQPIRLNAFCISFNQARRLDIQIWVQMPIRKG